MFFLKNRGVTSGKTTASQQVPSEPRKNGKGFFLFKPSHESNLYSGPDFLYENEAWAPDYQQTRLYDK
jgi:hypothetical protein